MPQGIMHPNASTSLMPPMPRPITDDAKRSARASSNNAIKTKPTAPTQ
ncbi:hypothetical protein PMAG_a1749 [Pseudoalteromonas mariniglutinosa NCIMB 1770]|nr:hypothetical protein [Pseudoalteromonas mariniglutinosa NCIMB 1770]